MFVRSGILAASILLSVTSCAAPSLEDAQRHVMPLGQTSFSHMSMTYRPDNPMYGESGAERLCWNGQSKAESKACEEGAEIWYSGERHQPGDGRNCAKLTFNPWYDEQLAGILDVMAR